MNGGICDAETIAVMEWGQQHPVQLFFAFIVYSHLIIYRHYDSSTNVYAFFKLLSPCHLLIIHCSFYTFVIAHPGGLGRTFEVVWLLCVNIH